MSHQDPKNPPDIIRFPDGSVFERANNIDDDRRAPQFRRSPPAFVPHNSDQRFQVENMHHFRNDRDNHTVSRMADLPDNADHPVLPSIEGVPPPRKHSLEPVNYRASNQTPVHHHNVEDLSKKVNVISADDGSIFPRKKPRVEFETFPGEPVSRGRENERPLFVSEVDRSRSDFHERRYPPREFPTARLLGTRPFSFYDDYPHFRDEELRQFGRQPDRELVGSTAPMQIFPPKSRAPNKFIEGDREHRQWVSDSLKESQPVISNNNGPISPKFLSTFDDSCYVTRGKGQPVGPKQVPHYSTPVPSFTRTEASNDRSRRQQPQSYFDSNRLPVRRQDPLLERDIIPNSGARAYPRDIPPEPHEMREPFRRAPHRLIPQEGDANTAQARYRPYERLNENDAVHALYDLPLPHPQRRYVRSPPPIQPVTRAPVLRPHGYPAEPEPEPIRRNFGDVVHEPQRPPFPINHGERPDFEDRR